MNNKDKATTAQKTYIEALVAERLPVELRHHYTDGLDTVTKRAAAAQIRSLKMFPKI